MCFEALLKYNEYVAVTDDFVLSILLRTVQLQCCRRGRNNRMRINSIIEIRNVFIPRGSTISAHENSSIVFPRVTGDKKVYKCTLCVRVYIKRVQYIVHFFFWSTSTNELCRDDGCVGTPGAVHILHTPELRVKRHLHILNFYCISSEEYK